VRAGLVARGYDSSRVLMRDAFPTLEERATELNVTTVAAGFNFDDGGTQIELGSDLTERAYTIEFWTFGVSQEYGRNVANLVRAIVEDNDGHIPLKDIGVVGQPEIGALVLDQVRVVRQVNRDPRPWDMFVFTTRVEVTDTYYPALVD
jgi:hypothetical protein